MQHASIGVGATDRCEGGWWGDQGGDAHVPDLVQEVHRAQGAAWAPFWPCTCTCSLLGIQYGSSALRYTHARAHTLTHMRAHTHTPSQSHQADAQCSLHCSNLCHRTLLTCPFTFGWFLAHSPGLGFGFDLYSYAHLDHLFHSLCG